MTQAEKIVQDMLDDYLSNPSKWLLKPKAMELIQQVAERTLEEGQEYMEAELITYAKKHRRFKVPNILSCRWWEEEA